jgi:hypothetical protein
MTGSAPSTLGIYVILFCVSALPFGHFALNYKHILLFAAVKKQGRGKNSIYTAFKDGFFEYGILLKFEKQRSENLSNQMGCCLNHWRKLSENLPGGRI